MKFTITIDEQTGAHGLTLIHRSNETNFELSEAEIEHLIEQASLDLDGAKIEFLGYKEGDTDE